MINRAKSDQLEDAIELFERNWTDASRSSIDKLLEDHSLAGDEEALAEIIRVDIELRYRNGSPIELDEYLDEFEWLLGNPEYVAQIAFEDYRSRLNSGHPMTAQRWRHLPGVRGEHWYQKLQKESSRAKNEPRFNTIESSSDPNEAFEAELDDVGFRLVKKIGEGALSRVYLATQNDLADRYVVLKIVSESMSEPQHMALLQHTNIVPIYSFHPILDRSVICMPYAGRVTLKDYMDSHQASSLRGGQSLVDTVKANVNETRIESETAQSTEFGEAASNAAADDAYVLKPLDRLISLGNDDLATWIFSRLAGALAHSHARGVLHNDLKPGNVLIRNDGEPALLDFNLSESLQNKQAAYAGGTLPYMSPEMFRRLMGQDSKPGPQSDIYSMGVMLYQLVTGRLPHPAPSSVAPIDLQLAIDSRNAKPTWEVQDGVSPGLCRIISRCLEFRPQDRYATADELQQDLQSEHQNQPLANSTEPRSWRIRKFFRRHPALTSSSSVGAMLLSLLLLLGYFAIQWKKETTHLSAVHAFDAFSKESIEALSTLAANIDEFDETGIEQSMKLLERYGLLQQNGLSQLTSPQSGDAQTQKVRDVSLLHLLQIGHMESVRLEKVSSGKTLPESQTVHLRTILDSTERISNGQGARAIGLLSASHARLVGDHKLAEKLEAQAKQQHVDTDIEIYLEAMRLFNHDQFNDAAQLLQQIPDDNSTIPSTLRWTSLGRSQKRDNKHELAKLSFTQSIQRAPKLAGLRVLRALCHMALREGTRAEEDFNKALELDPNNRIALVNRGSFLLGNRRAEEAIADFSAVLELKPNSAHAMLSRSRAYRLIGREEEADRDFQQAMKFDDLDNYSLHVRARAREDSDPEGAIDDIRRALGMKPDDPLLLRRMAHLLSRKFGQEEEAIEYYTKAIRVQPADEYGRIDRAVLLARAGRYEEAEDDVRIALQAPNSGRTLYQTACIYALMSEQRSHRLALKYLSMAIRAGYNANNLRNDPDLESIRDMPDFDAIKRMYQLSRQPGRRKA